MAKQATKPPQPQRPARLPTMLHIARAPQPPDPAPVAPTGGATRIDRLRMRLTLSIIVALVIAFGSVSLAARLTQFLLQGVQVGAATSAPGTGNATPLVAPISALPGGIAVAVGATQSYAGVAITLNNLQIVKATDLVGAPAGEEIAILTDNLVNTQSIGTIPYNAYDFVLVDQASHVRHEDFAALVHPLGTGTLDAAAHVSGDIAFLVKIPTDPTAPDPQIVYIAETNPTAAALRWSLPLGPSGL